MKIGARTLKTGLAITLTVFLVNILETKVGNVEYNVAGMAAITAIIGMQPSIKGSLETFRNRVIATFIGTLMAFIIAYTFGLNALYLGLGSIAIIIVCIKSGLNESIRFALVTLAALGTHHQDFNIMDVVYRVSGMLIGLSVSTGLNIIFMPPDYSGDLKAKINDSRLKFEGLYEDAIGDILRKEKTGKKIIKDKRQIIRDELEDTRDIYSLLVGDISHANINLFKRYRRAINAVQSNLDRLMALHRGIVFMHGGSQYSELRQDLHEYLQYLLTLHKQIYDCIVFNKNSQKVGKYVDEETIRKKIVRFIKADSDDDVFEFYNVYFEATRINEKLEQLKNEFELDF